MKDNHSLRRHERIRGRLSYEIAKRNARSLKGKWLIVNVSPNSLAFNRIGISISTRTSHKSTRRNRLKRLIREAYRLHKKGLKQGFDIIVRARPIRRDLLLQEVEGDLLDIFKKHRIEA